MALRAASATAVDGRAKNLRSVRASCSRRAFLQPEPQLAKERWRPVGVVSFASPVLRVPAALHIPSKHALTFYVGHLAVIWGVPFVPGLHRRVGMTQCFTAAAALAMAV